MVNNDVLSAFHTIRDALKEEKQKLEARLWEINQALGEETRSRQPRNPLSLKEAVLLVLSKGPLTRHEILEEVQKLGYHFSTNAPLNSICNIIYGKSTKLQKENGKFSLPKGSR